MQHMEKRRANEAVPMVMKRKYRLLKSVTQRVFLVVLRSSPMRRQLIPATIPYVGSTIRLMLELRVANVDTKVGLRVVILVTTFPSLVAAPAVHLVLTEGIPAPAAVLGVYQLSYARTYSFPRSVPQVPVTYLDVK